MLTDDDRLFREVTELLEQYAKYEARKAYNEARNQTPYIDFDDYWKFKQEGE